MPSCVKCGWKYPPLWRTEVVWGLICKFLVVNLYRDLQNPRVEPRREQRQLFEASVCLVDTMWTVLSVSNSHIWDRAFFLNSNCCCSVLRLLAPSLFIISKVFIQNLVLAVGYIMNKSALFQNGWKCVPDGIADEVQTELRHFFFFFNSEVLPLMVLVPYPSCPDLLLTPDSHSAGSETSLSTIVVVILSMLLTWL